MIVVTIRQAGNVKVSGSPAISPVSPINISWNVARLPLPNHKPYRTITATVINL